MLKKGWRLPALICGAVLLITGSVASASGGTKPSVVKTNDANHDGTYSAAENVPKNVSYPWVVTYKLSIDAGTFGPHTIVGISDSMTSNLTSGTASPSCSTLVGTVVPASTSVDCYYDVALAGPSSSTLQNTATITWDRGGGDTTSSMSTVDFPSLSLTKSSTTTFVSSAGQVVPYSYLVTNTGTVAVTGISLSDNNTDAAPSCPATSLAPAASMTCTAQHTATSAELLAAKVDNTATATSNEAADVKSSLSIPAAPFAAGGSFVVGDLTVGPIGSSMGTAVNFWGAQWWKNNALSGGTGPAAFKGFEDAPAVPTCGVNWTSRPGNSTPPPATIPPYLAIIVSSSITKSGSSITGDIQHIVIVKTNAGYEGNPGHAGTGTIVSVVC